MALVYFIFMCMARNHGVDISEAETLLIGLFYIGDVMLITRRSKDGK